MKNLILALTFIFQTNIALASGTTIGNGGNGIVCKNSAGTITSVELLDFFEARTNGQTLKLNPNHSNYQDVIIENLKRWQKVAPKRIAMYLQWLNEFENDVLIAPNIKIPAIPDTGSIVIPTDCELKPIAFQRPDSEIYPGVKRYTIDKNMWDLMDTVQKAGLVMHELIYREGITMKHATSFPSRYLNAYFATQNPNAEIYASIMSQLPLAWTEFGGMIVQIMSNDQRVSTIGENGTIKGIIEDLYGDVITKKLSFIGLYSRFPDNRKRINIEYNGLNFRLYNQSSFSADIIKVSSSRYHLELITTDLGEVTSIDISLKATLSAIQFSCEKCTHIKVLKLNDPEKNWFMTKSHQKISNIHSAVTEHTFDDSYVTQLLTTTGEKWVWDFEQHDFIKSK